MGENDILIIFFFLCDEICFGYLIFVMPCRDISVIFGCIHKRYNVFIVL